MRNCLPAEQLRTRDCMSVAVVQAQRARCATEHATRNTKIVCTLGPASGTAGKIQSLMAAGANVFRLNFSHSDHDWHARVLHTVRTVASDLDRPVAVIQDLCGPKIRVSQLARNVLEVVEGDLRDPAAVQRAVEGVRDREWIDTFALGAQATITFPIADAIAPEQTSTTS